MGFSCEGCGRYIEGVPHSISGKPFCDQCRAGTEQAYHARGAGRTCHCGTPSEPHNESVHEEAWAEHILKMATTRREPGADTGTTPPRDAELQEAYEEGVQDGMDEEAALAKTAERGTTPPEGLDWWTEAAADVVRHARTDSSPNWQNAIVGGLLRAYNRGQDAATQRAPVEQGREKRLPDGAEAMMLDVAEDISQQFCGGSEAVTEIIAAKLTEIIYNSKPTAAPDHAREGALRTLATAWYSRARVSSSMGLIRAYETCAAELERALADGKEGGE